MQGLQNLGSTCAINTLIQLICRTKLLRENLLSEHVQPNTFSGELKEILDLMHNQNHSLQPKKFVNKLYSYLQIFNRGEQIDIGELWMFLFEKIANELNTERYNVNYVNSIHHPLNEKCIEIMEKINNKKSSLWQVNCQGIILSTVTCTQCNNKIHNFEPFISLPLDIHENNNSIVDMFKAFLKTTEHQGDWRCEHCNDFTKYKKQQQLWKVPKVLIFLIKRFNDFYQKNSLCIHVNTDLQINNISYNYVGSGNHYGNLFGGHYCALCKVDKQYILYDDLNVSIIDEGKFQTFAKDTYLLFYEIA